MEFMLKYKEIEYSTYIYFIIVTIH